MNARRHRPSVSADKGLAPYTPNRRFKYPKVTIPSSCALYTGVLMGGMRFIWKGG